MSHLDPSDTIAAIASPGGAGLQGLVRVTGPGAWAVVLEEFADDLGPSWPVHAARRVGRLRVDGLRSPLRVALGLWPGPRTYTGQPLVEIHLSGAPPLLRQVLGHCLARGARLAEPGEFTLRAFLSGRIDLTQSEAVLGVIDARTPAQLDAALRQLAGGLAAPITRLRDRLADILAHLEANLDFAEEPDVDPLGVAALAAILDESAAEVDALAGRLQGRDRPGGRPRVVLVGPPNAGKSRLFNALLGGERALVSPVAGTTRDYLEAPCDCDGLVIDLVDTAGVEPTTAAGSIANQAQAGTEAQATRADLLLDCQSADAGRLAEPGCATRCPRLGVWTKVDAFPPGSPAGLLLTSATTGDGLASLRRAIASALRARACDEESNHLPAGTAARCGESLAAAGRALRVAATTLRQGGGDELVAVDLRQGLDDLGRVVGAVVTDDLLDRIFRRFCIGK